MSIASPLTRDDLFPLPRMAARIRKVGLDFERLRFEELWSLIASMEAEIGVEFVRLDFGVPDLAPPAVAVSKQAKMLRTSHVAARYAPPEGVPKLRSAAAHFLQAALGIVVGPDCCTVTCGATEALFVAQAVAGRRRRGRDTILFLDPGYPPARVQARILGLQQLGIDLYEYRGERLIAKVLQLVATERIGALCWSCPNNPTWLFLTTEELRALGEICNRADIVPIEDLAYLGVDPSAGWAAALQPTIASYAKRYFLILSASKMLSYAGERIGILVGSPLLLTARHEGLAATFGTDDVRRAVTSLVFNLTAGAPHSAQLAVAEVLEAINRREYDLIGSLHPYRERARAVKSMMLRRGFRLIYTPDDGRELGDGFYFTFGFPGFDGPELLQELLAYGIAALPLVAFGSNRREGLRACTARLDEENLARLDRRLHLFSEDHPQSGTTAK